jgi:hypothetical protein
MTQYQDYGYSRPDTITTTDLQEQKRGNPTLKKREHKTKNKIHKQFELQQQLHVHDPTYRTVNTVVDKSAHLIR